MQELILNSWTKKGQVCLRITQTILHNWLQKLPLSSSHFYCSLSFACSSHFPYCKQACSMWRGTWLLFLSEYKSLLLLQQPLCPVQEKFFLDCSRSVLNLWPNHHSEALAVDLCSSALGWKRRKIYKESNQIGWYNKATVNSCAGLAAQGHQ